MKVCVVGHGPSMKGKKLGKKIDSYDKVVRLKGSSSVFGSEDYGMKCNALCASTEVMGVFRRQPADEYWAYPKKGEFSHPVAMKVITEIEKPVMIPLLFSNHWNQRFRMMGADHPNVSTGMAAILFAILRWRPEEIVLAGFDTLVNPDIRFDRNHDIPRTGVGAYPNHDWKLENQLLQILSHIYKVSIVEIRNDIL